MIVAPNIGVKFVEVGPENPQEPVICPPVRPFRFGGSWRRRLRHGRCGVTVRPQPCSGPLCLAWMCGQFSVMKGFPDLPPLWLVAFMALAWIIARFVPIITVPLDLFIMFGIICAVVGFALITWSAVWFRRKRTTIEPHHTPGTLIVEGPYKLSRNPIYLGMFIILTGYVFWLCSLTPLILPPLFLMILTARFAKPEEASLIEAFGDEARAYLSATRRWI